MTVKARILIIDDEPDMRYLMARALRRNGCTVTTAESGSEGLRLAIAEEFDLITSDIDLGGNLFNARVERYTTNGVTYIVKTPDGARRYYQEMSSFGISADTNHLDRVRPYLTRWEDHAGNYHLFYYGTNSQADDFGQLTRIESANGNFLSFQYDFFGRIYEAFSGDGRHVKYQYDDFGDLTAVTLPDNSQWQFEYQHFSFNTTNGSTIQTNWDSYHLLTKETKPYGRVLVNAYDNLRRVTTQASTVGTNEVLVTNAYFFYTNNASDITNEMLTGVTRIEDVFHNPTFYFYTNNLITQTVDPLGGTTIQNWFEDSETNKSGFYQRSLEFSVDKRGLTNSFAYDASGNVTSLKISGELKGDGDFSQSATNAFTYTNNLPLTVTDPSGNTTTFFYEDTNDAFRATRQVLTSGGVGIYTNRFSYTNVAVIVDMGGWTKTNQAFGLRFREVRADTATNELSFEGRGYPVSSVQYTPHSG